MSRTLTDALAAATISSNDAEITGASIGTASSDRIVVALIAHERGLCTGVTIGGASATIATHAANSYLSGGVVAWLNVTTGTTADIVATFSSAPTNVAIEVHAVTGMETTAYDTAEATTNNDGDISTTIDTLTGGHILAVASSRGAAGGSAAVTGLTQSNTDTVGGRAQWAGYNDSPGTNTGLSIGRNFDNSSSSGFAAVAFEPASGATTHATTGALAGGGAAAAGSATNYTIHAVTGALEAGGASLTASASRSRVFATSGALAAAGAAVTGSSTLIKTHDVTGALAGGGAAAAGSAVVARVHDVTGALVGGGAATTGTAVGPAPVQTVYVDVSPANIAWSGQSVTIEPVRVEVAAASMSWTGGFVLVGPGNGLSSAVTAPTLQRYTEWEKPDGIDPQWWARFMAVEQEKATKIEEAFAGLTTQVTDMTTLLSEIQAAQALATTANDNATEAKNTINIANSYVSPSAPATAANDGSITIDAHTRYYGDGTSVSVNSGSLSGYSSGDYVTIYYKDAAREGGAVTYYGTTDAVAQAGDTHVVAQATIPAGGEPPASGSGTSAPGYTPPSGGGSRNYIIP